MRCEGCTVRKGFAFVVSKQYLTITWRCCWIMRPEERRACKSYLRAVNECFAEAARPQHQAISGYLADWLPEYAQLVRNSRVGQSAFLYPQLLEAAAAFSKVDCVFLSEAAWWFEQQEGKAEHLAAGSAASDAETELPARLSTARAELALLRLRGLEDNELTVLDRLEG